MTLGKENIVVAEQNLKEKKRAPNCPQNRREENDAGGHLFRGGGSPNREGQERAPWGRKRTRKKIQIVRPLFTEIGSR